MVAATATMPVTARARTRARDVLSMELLLRGAGGGMSPPWAFTERGPPRIEIHSYVGRSYYVERSIGLLRPESSSILHRGARFWPVGLLRSRTTDRWPPDGTVAVIAKETLK